MQIEENAGKRTNLTSRGDTVSLIFLPICNAAQGSLHITEGIYQIPILGIQYQNENTEIIEILFLKFALFSNNNIP